MWTMMGWPGEYCVAALRMARYLRRLSRIAAPAGLVALI
jgi:Na+(H+)/acetate symporter ActP